MFKHLLVPLDGSRLAEAALQPAELLARKLGGRVTLIHIIEKNAPAEIHGERHLTDEDEACKYLDETAVRVFGEAAEVECHVHSEEVRNVARSITQHISELAPDLIVMCAHGHGGLRDMMVGSIAQQVIGMGKTPVLLLQPGEESGSADLAFRRFLIGLDGVPEHEASLQTGGELAQALGAGLHLVNVVQTMETLRGEHAAAGRLLPATTLAMLDMTAASALDYLDSRADVWRARGLEVTTQVRRGDVPRELAQAAAENDCDLLVLGTHGRAGIGAFWSGSVAPKVVGQTHAAILFVPARIV